MRPLTGIILHCTATRPDFLEGASTAARLAEVRRWHVEGNGWSDVGYHVLVDRDGTVLAGRPIETTGAHVRGHNTGTIGISLFGGHGAAETDRFADHFTAEQDQSLRRLIADLQQRFGPLPVSGHNDYAAKACPGFSVAEWLVEPSSEEGSPAAADPGSTRIPAGMTVLDDSADLGTDLLAEVARYRWRLAAIRDSAADALDAR